MADEVEIVEYDPRWPERFALESARIRRVLAEPALEIEHHGSTAVPGLAAKPVIDMLVAVESIEIAERYTAALIQDGYEPVEARYRELWPERIVLIRREYGARMCHVHLMLRGHPTWKRLLVFRTTCGASRGRRGIRRAQALAGGAIGSDRHAYMTAKGDFITRTTATAMRAQGFDTMKAVANVLVGFVALSHIGFLILEMFFWDHPVGRRIFGMTPEVSAAPRRSPPIRASTTAFSPPGLLWALWADRRELKVFFLGCVIVAGIFGGLTAKTSILLTQALPAAIALAMCEARGRAKPLMTVTRGVLR